ncbi:MAG: thioredoxin family protein, partial [Acidobacteriota bacterium]|nr:thioredoxin family protein [Acidobacteriota bacterium]
NRRYGKIIKGIGIKSIEIMFQKIRSKIFILLFGAFIVFPAAGFAQNPVSWSLESEAKGKTLKSGERFTAKLKAQIEDNWHLYAVEQPEGGPYPTKITAAENLPFKIDGKSESPAVITKFDPNFQIETKYFAEQAEFNLPISATSDVKVDDLAVNVKYQVCDDKVCLPPKTVRVSFAGFEDVKKSGQRSAVNSQPTTPENQNPASNNEPQTTTFANSQNSTNPINSTNSLWSFLWLAVTLGALSLLTPCVFPMIPITVSYFTNHSAGNRGKAIRMATVYSLGIIGTFTLVGMLLAIFVGAAGITLFAANPYVNLLIAGIFLFFAFNLFGAYEIAIPTSILTKLDNLTRSREGEGSGIVGALLMGLTFTLTSFTCTSPFVGTILVSASQGNWQMPLVGMLAFSSVFALPFFVLALLPQYVSSLPRAGGWMNSIKVAMGFLEIAAAMKFLSNVDLIWKWEIFTRNFVLSIWIAIGVILAIYLLGKFQLPHDSKPERIGAIRVVSAILSLAISFYLLTGLFGARLGELESFLPPELETSRNFFNKSDAEKLQWIDNDYEAALAKAKAENKQVFIDFTGYTCTNCRWMEANVFPKKAVEDEMKKFVLARLYTDGDGEIYEKQQLFQEQTFQTVALPFYAIMNSDGKTIATFPGLTRDAQEFVDFLKKAEEN